MAKFELGKIRKESGLKTIKFSEWIKESEPEKLAGE